MSHVHDLLGVGLGPFGLSLAALADGVEGLDAVFVDQREAFSWHPGLLLEGATLQVPFLADLVTMVDPTSRWSFLNYLRERGRLFRFYFAERFLVPRREYDAYLRWVAESLPSARFGTRVESLTWDVGQSAYRVRCADATTGAVTELLAKAVVLGVGTEPVVPEAFRDLKGKNVVHVADYLDSRPLLHEAGTVTVVGSGQSGAEVFLDLLQSQPETGTKLQWLSRTQAFAPMEYSKLGLEHFTPDYTAYFHSLPEQTREQLVPSQWQLYKGISADTIAAIYDLLYERTVDGRRVAAELRPGVGVTAARAAGDGLVLECEHGQQGSGFRVETDAVVLATGYAARRPVFLEPLLDQLELDERGRYRVELDHRVVTADGLGPLFVQNAEAHTHGVGAPDLGLGAWRAGTILSAITGRDLLPANEGAFTTFGAP
ncbi:lysine N(6)-hydroxylase/L-ornithine N(5)-oxygenase family protein [Nocardioides sp.]|uniref:lysine N(6)-hydroxylase/L-ornithine N(5)-oxygenase family protein n=1 Tax=Nocardioides sp. TaxID=35761 RepID=UPI002B561000|nr:SidA/IucD/PvdA family monooxygenase [Nocardioides sp.]HSX65894.1 SidA/IucD/PvdA family monooxygenase [Nocardioides sp.]